MELTKKDKQIVKIWGFPESDMPQICEAARRCKLTDVNDKRLSAKKAIEILGRETWLNGISRAAFHWTCERGEGKNCVSFDCSSMFK